MTTLTPQDAKPESSLREILELRAERDELAAQNKELVDALELVVQHDGKLTGADFVAIQSALTRSKQ